MVIFNWLCILFGEFKLHFVAEQELDEKVHHLAVLFILEVFIQKHLNTAGNQQFTSTLVLMNSRNRTIAWIS